MVVLVGCFDCRSRRAARGTVRSRANSSRKRRSLVLPLRSEGRKSVGSRVRAVKLEVGGGPAARQFAKAEGRVGTRRWKALRAGKTVSFDEGAGRSGSGGTSRFRLRVSRQGASEVGSSSLLTVENAGAEGRRSRGSSIERPRQERTAPAPSSDDERSVDRKPPKLVMHRQVHDHSSCSLGLWLHRTCRGRKIASPRESSVRAGARVVIAVAEVGEKHLLDRGSVSREAGGKSTR